MGMPHARTVTTASVVALDHWLADPQRPGSFTVDRDAVWKTLRGETADGIWADAVAWWITRVIVYAPPTGLEINAEVVSADGTWVSLLMDMINRLRRGVPETAIAATIRALARSETLSAAVDLVAGAAHALCSALATCSATHRDLVKATHAMGWACRDSDVSPYVEAVLAQSITMAHSLDVERRKAPLLGLWQFCQETEDEDMLLDGLSAMGTLAATYPDSPANANSQVVILGPDGVPISMVTIEDIDPAPTHDDDDMLWTAAVSSRLVSAARGGDAHAVADVLEPVSTPPQRLSMIEMMARLIRDRLAGNDLWLTPR